MILRILPEVRIAFREATRWRAENRPRTARGFIHAYETAIEKIQDSPLQYPLTEEVVPGIETRYFSLKRFPYKLIYFAIESEIVVVALVHHHQDSTHRINRITEES